MIACAFFGGAFFGMILGVCCTALIVEGLERRDDDNYGD